MTDDLEEAKRMVGLLAELIDSLGKLAQGDENGAAAAFQRVLLTLAWGIARNEHVTLLSMDRVSLEALKRLARQGVSAAARERFDRLFCGAHPKQNPAASGN